MWVLSHPQRQHSVEVYQTLEREVLIRRARSARPGTAGSTSSTCRFPEIKLSRLNKIWVGAENKVENAD